MAGDRRVRTLAFAAAVPQRFAVGGAGSREQLRPGATAAAPPGGLAGWYSLLAAHGSKTLAEVLAPAITLARDGFPLTGCTTAAINRAAATLRDRPGFAAWSAAFTGGRGEVQEGDVLRQPDLAATLEAIAAGGIRHLYGGPLGLQLVAHVQSLGGCLAQADLDSVSPGWERPVSVAYRDLVVHTLRPPAQAFEFLLALRILDGVEPGSPERGGVRQLDTVWRALRLAAMACRADPPGGDFERLLADESVARLRGRVADGRPVEGAVERRPEAEQDATSLAVGDRAGNLVCITQSLGGPFGCGVVVPGTGLCLNNALNGAGHDKLQPGRMVTGPMAPAVATRGLVPVLALGAAGGDATSRLQAQALVQYVDFGLSLQDALAAPRVLLCDGRRVLAESRLPPACWRGCASAGTRSSPGTPGWRGPAASRRSRPGRRRG